MAARANLNRSENNRRLPFDKPEELAWRLSNVMKIPNADFLQRWIELSELDALLRKPSIARQSMYRTFLGNTSPRKETRQL
jgi:hypothetical protein